ncbi:disulfide bond formation protein B [Neptuniibacter caesariensis]|uniref:Disulfide bond formation protein n=1 Tax=Neptuniibacter caesariensis TaxID=207954 RepID=A0A7U8C925_NEPCE|nr:disulfide bond formation protein B [Neptuniibacter caesariensis]EAR62379.1 disulfide bond formation protein [Oceanospirillum sp. MED92] [Neptuniibacter caesariensis]
MLDKLTCISRSTWYWLGLIATGIGMEAVALYYQYALDYYPCVLCIHVRIWVLALILIGLLGLITRKQQGLSKLSHLLTLGAGIGLAERSWQTLAVERGWIIDECSMDSGLPDWFALDKWFPSVFQPWEPCGYTPELLFGVTMAEGLMAFSALLVISSALFFALQFRRHQ